MMSQKPSLNQLRKENQVAVAGRKSFAGMTPSSSETATVQPLQMGWAISKVHRGSFGFSPRVREYLTAKFEIGK